MLGSGLVKKLREAVKRVKDILGEPLFNFLVLGIVFVLASELLMVLHGFFIMLGIPASALWGIPLIAMACAVLGAIPLGIVVGYFVKTFIFDILLDGKKGELYSVGFDWKWSLGCVIIGIFLLLFGVLMVSLNFFLGALVGIVFGLLYVSFGIYSYLTLKE